jgi:hypothetical protein
LKDYDCTDWAQCLARQSAIERRLIADGYQLVTAERRRGQERRTIPRDVPDRRRDISSLSD